MRGIRGGGEARPSRKNPLYKGPNPQWDAMLAVSAGCRNMMEKVRDHAPEYIIGGSSTTIRWAATSLLFVNVEISSRASWMSQMLNRRAWIFGSS